jgi:hypothetical protein
VGEAIYDSLLELPPGGRVERLLVFNTTEDPSRKLELIVGPIQTPAGEVLAAFPWRGEELK